MKFMLKLLNQNYLTNIYIGVTGLLVAIVVFIAEVIEKQNNELYKRVILTETKIKSNIVLTLIIFGYMIFSNCFNYHKYKPILNYSNLTFIITHFILFLMIIISIIKTGKMFLIVLNINVKEDYFNKKLDNYIQKKVLTLEIDANKVGKTKNKIEKTKFYEFINNSKLFYFTDKNILMDNIDKYEPIYSIKNEIIKSFDYKKLNEIKEKFIVNKNNDIIYNPTSEYVVYIADFIDEKVNDRQPIFYCLKKYKTFFNGITSAVRYGDNRAYIDDEINYIHNCLFDMALKEKKFDESKRLYNYFNFIYKNQLITIKNMTIDKIYNCYKVVYDDYSKNKQFLKFLNSISSIIYSNNEYNDYNIISKIQEYLYIKQLYIPKTDKCQIAYEFANNILDYNIYEAKKNEDKRYYDTLMAMFLKFISNLIKINDFEAVKILLTNVYIEKINYLDDDIDELDIINFQFCIGIIYCLYILAKENEKIEKNAESINYLIEYLEHHFINIYDLWRTIKIFRNCFDKKTETQKVYSNFDFELVDHKYKNNWAGYCIDNKEILKELIYVFDITLFDRNKVNLNEITKTDKYYYQGLLGMVEDKKETNLDNILNIHYNSLNLIKLLNIIIDDANKKEEEFNRKHKLNNENVLKFKNLVTKKINNDISIIKTLKKYNKVQQSNDKIHKVFGVNQLVNREFFFDNAEIESLAENFYDVFNFGLDNEYSKKINQESKLSTNTFEREIKSIKNLNEYVIFATNMSNKIFEKYKFNYQKQTINIKNTNVMVINLPNIDGVILIKKKDLPTIKFCKFAEEWKKENISNNSYYEFIDCAEDKKLRKKLIKNLDWIKKKGNSNEQDYYLKGFINLKIYLSFVIEKKGNANGIRFKMDEK